MAEINEKSSLHDVCTAFIGIFAALMLIASRWVVDTTDPAPFYKGPLIFPVIILCTMIIFSVPSIIKILFRKDKLEYTLDQEGVPGKAIVIFVFLIIFVFGIVGIGLELSTFIFTSFSLYFLGLRSLKTTFLLPLVTVFVLWFLFKFMLDVWFPTPYLFELFMEQ